MDKKTGNIRISGKQLAKLMHWALIGTDANLNDFVKYFNDTYKGIYQTIEYETVWSAYSDINGNEKDKCAVEIENFLNRKREEMKKTA